VFDATLLQRVSVVSGWGQASCTWQEARQEVHNTAENATRGTDKCANPRNHSNLTIDLINI
jgi:hypothetical protein